MNDDVRKPFDCVKMKDEAQAQLLADLEGMTADQQIEVTNRAASNLTEKLHTVKS
ncbi:MAG TPA: hypothetical protein VJ521_09475 [Acidobacteriota bacterium]|nr:hypothetical protein [Acidobacteriota bacterium]